ncbi:hypothetical protein L6R52_07090 [Myxococcota bacterium]|nr:hypothetical protein [Myxococcota bacterium]
MVVVLVISNLGWAYLLLDAGVSLTHQRDALDEHRDALRQALTLLPIVAQSGVSRERIVSAARPAGDALEPFEKDGFVWVGRLGLRFSDQGRLVEARPSWDPP